MAAVRSKGNKATELASLRFSRGTASKAGDGIYLCWAARILFSAKTDSRFCGWMFLARLPEHLRKPKGNRQYWRHKSSATGNETLFVTQGLRRAGWRVLRIWEHDLKNESRSLPVFGN